jgi:uncharacterized protein YaeQ
VATKPTIYKIKIMLSDLDRNYFEPVNLTIALHPSETLERMMVRVLAFCINAQERLEFSKGLSEPDEPDIWLHSLDDRMELWIDVGEPAADRIKKATHIAEAVKVYSFNHKSSAWWKLEGDKFKNLDAEIFQVPWESAQQLARLVERTMDCSVTISGDTAYFSTAKGDGEISWVALT